MSGQDPDAVTSRSLCRPQSDRSIVAAGRQYRLVIRQGHAVDRSTVLQYGVEQVWRTSDGCRAVRCRRLWFFGSHRSSYTRRRRTNSRRCIALNTCSDVILYTNAIRTLGNNHRKRFDQIQSTQYKWMTFTVRRIGNHNENRKAQWPLPHVACANALPCNSASTDDD